MAANSNHRKYLMQIAVFPRRDSNTRTHVGSLAISIFLYPVDVSAICTDKVFSERIFR